MSNDLFKMIKEDHEEVKKIMEQITETTGRAVKKREELFMMLKIEIQPHLEAEENVYYPAIMDGKDSRPIVLEGFEEHRLAKQLLSELENMPFDDEVWAPKFKVFKENVEHHIEEEESDIFSVTKDNLDKDRINEIARMFEEAKEQIKMKIRGR